jgi:hypothetical protein
VVLQAAREEPNVRLVEDYVDAIRILREEKRFTFREIAEWLTQNFCIEADHNAVYRAYTKGMSEDQACQADLDDQMEEQERTGP